MPDSTNSKLSPPVAIPDKDAVVSMTTALFDAMERHEHGDDGEVMTASLVQALACTLSCMPRVKTPDGVRDEVAAISQTIVEVVIDGWSAQEMMASLESGMVVGGHA